MKICLYPWRFISLSLLLLPLLSCSFITHANWNDVESGTLLLTFDGNSQQWVAPRLENKVSIQVSGPIVRSTVTQTFHNPGKQWADATYVFPLPETAAVDHMRLEIGERIIEGQIKEKKAAKQLYDKAKKSGKSASLVSQQRSNLFTTRVANIPPGETVRVTIEYQHPVDKNGNIYSLRFPMTITPRYIPGQPLLANDNSQTPATTGDGLSPNTTIVKDASHITPPWDVQGANAHPTTLSIDLQPGFNIESATSLYHGIQQTHIDKDKQILTLDSGSHNANADFVLQWQPQKNSAPTISLFTETFQQQTYSLLMMMPPQADLQKKLQAREVIYVIDTSGSMGGESIRQARQALLWALNRLQAEDSFNIIEFNSGTWSLFGSAMAANNHNIDRAKTFVNALRARGGTEMRDALETALCGLCGNSEKIRQVIFLTDGAIGNEDQLLRIIEQKLGNSRLFTIGIGSAPNTFFMRKAAETGRGTFTYIADINKAGESMARLFSRLEKPVLTDLQVQPSSLATRKNTFSIVPNPIPDLYDGQPITLLIKGSLPEKLTLHGKLGGLPWEKTLNALESKDSTGIHVLWARQKIEQLIDQRRYSYGSQDQEQLKHAITTIALDHHLVSPFTSLVAVDISPIKLQSRPSHKHNISNNSPKEASFGLAKTATPASQQLVIGILLLFFAGVLITLQRQDDRKKALNVMALLSVQRQQQIQLLTQR